MDEITPSIGSTIEAAPRSLSRGMAKVERSRGDEMQKRRAAR